MPSTNFGQYSVISYVHPLRGERVNLGVLVWHPLFGKASQFIRNLSRVRNVDEKVGLDRVRSELDLIGEILANWAEEVESPLDYLASKFQNSVIVTAPLNARIQDPSATLDRLYSSLIAPEPFARASSTRQFANAFASRLKNLLIQQGHGEVQTNFLEFHGISLTFGLAQYRDSNAVWHE